MSINSQSAAPREPAEPRASSALPLVTVAICTRNRADRLREAVRSVMAQMNAGTELLIVDNASTDHTLEAATTMAAQHPCIRVTVEPTPGVAAARNAALVQARGEFVLFFDDDQRAEPGWLAAYHQFLLRHERGRIGCVGGGVVTQFEAPPPGWYTIGEGSLDMGGQELRFEGSATPWCGNAAYNRAAALELGGFCPDLQRCEESDLNARLAKHGYELWWVPGARIEHLIAASRLRVGWRLRTAFSEGRSVALLRLRAWDKALQRFGYGLIRVVTAPFQCAAMLLAAALTIPLRSGRTAVRLLERAARVLGIGYGLLAHSMKRATANHLNGAKHDPG